MRSSELRQLSVCQFSSRTWSFDQDLLRYENLGFDSIGIWRQKIEAFGIDAAVDLVHESNLSVSSLHHAGGFTGDGTTTKDAVSDTLDAIRLAAQLNAEVLLLHPGAINGHLFGHISSHFQDTLDELLLSAEAYDVNLAIEPVFDQANSPFTFYKTLDETIRLLNDNPTLSVVLDLYHMGMNDIALERLDEYVDRIKLVQLADRSQKSLTYQRLAANRRQSFRLPLGDGEINIHAWLEKLSALGYTGPMELEVFGTEVFDACPFQLLDDTMTYLEGNDVRRAMAAQPASQDLPQRSRR